MELIKFYEEALRAAFEGVVVKNLDSIYDVGRRTYTWLKLKPERDTIDCTIVKGMYGKGKRAGLYSSFLLAVRDPEKKKLYTIGKVSNLTERTMETLRDTIERTRTSADEQGVFVQPSVVVEKQPTKKFKKPTNTRAAMLCGCLRLFGSDRTRG